jgi:hypothetical protein
VSTDRGCSWTPLPGVTAPDNCPGGMGPASTEDAAQDYPLYLQTTGGQVRRIATWNWLDKTKRSLHALRLGGRVRFCRLRNRCGATFRAFPARSQWFRGAPAER